MKRLRLAGLASCGLMLGGAVWAQEHAPTKAEAEVIGPLEAKAAGSSVELALVDHVTLGALKAEGFERIVLNISSKKAYVVIGACEETCTNLDISVYDGDDQVIDGVGLYEVVGAKH